MEPIEPKTPAEVNQAGQQAFRDGDYPRAADLFRRAEDLFAQEGDALNAAEMRNNRGVALLKAGQVDEAWDAVRGTDEIFAQAGDFRRQGMAVGNQASILEARNQYPEAIAAYEQSADLLRQAGEGDLRSSTLRSLSALQVKTGKRFEAMATMDAALSSQKRLSLKERLLKKLLKLPFDMMNR